MLISALNLFKAYVSNTFMLGMGILLAIYDILYIYHGNGFKVCKGKSS